MRKFQEKRKFRKVLYSRLSIGVLLVAVFFLGKSVVSSWQKYSVTSQARVEAYNEVAELKERKKSLEEEIEKLRSERGTEEILRDRFNAAAPGEEVINIVAE